MNVSSTVCSAETLLMESLYLVVAGCLLSTILLFFGFQVIFNVAGILALVIGSGTRS